MASSNCPITDPIGQMPSGLGDRHDVRSRGGQRREAEISIVSSSPGRPSGSRGWATAAGSADQSMAKGRAKIVARIQIQHDLPLTREGDGGQG